ncbi:N-acetyltransferase [Sporolactobacillus sp. THM7-4]|nr:N-acetyltransferase [Sporolactobacillus sp. THM7-4]
MDIQEGHNRFYMTDESGHEIAEVTYTQKGDSILVLDHTFVDPAYRGGAIARNLVKTVVEKARKENKKIIPVCSYAKAQFARVKDYQDVEYKGE